MKYCVDCIVAHTAECFLRTAEYLESCPDSMFAAGFLQYRERWDTKLRQMALNPNNPKYQGARNTLLLAVAGISRPL